MDIQPYIDQLEALAGNRGLALKRAFMLAGVPDSTYYRVLHGQDLRLDTAQRIAAAIEEWGHGRPATDQERAHPGGHA